MLSSTTSPDTSTPATTQPAVASDSPSQSEADALRDGVIPEVALLTPPLRVNPLVQVQAQEGTWVLGRLTDDVINDTMDDGCLLGDPAGVYPTEVICTVEYGEILLLDSRSEILKAYPMPGAVPSWIYVAESAVYAGRIGDGGLPDATLVRIDRASLKAIIVVMPAPVDGIQDWLPTWQVATPEQLAESPQLVGSAPDMSWGVPAESWIGDVIVDLEAIDEFLGQFAG